jgi:hypothetical protein
LADGRSGREVGEGTGACRQNNSGERTVAKSGLEASVEAGGEAAAWSEQEYRTRASRRRHGIPLVVPCSELLILFPMDDELMS